MRPVCCTVRLLTGDPACAPGLFRVDADTAPFGPEDATPESRACVRVRALLGLVGRAGLLGAFWCASPSPVAVVGALLVCSAPSGPGLPFFFSSAPPLSAAFCVLRPGVPWVLTSYCPPFPPPPPFFSLLFLCPLLLFFSPPWSLAFRVFGPGVPSALAPCCPPAPPPFFVFSLPACFFFPLFLWFLCGAGVVFVSWAVGCAGV